MERKATYTASGPTCGPWNSMPWDDVYREIVAPGGIQVALVAAGADQRCLGNVHLVEAAPDLLQACEELLSAWFDPHGSPEAVDDAAAMARAAIKKAREGVQQNEYLSISRS